MAARRWFHVLLGAVFVPIVTLPVVWGAAIYWRLRAADDEARRWARRLLWLAVADTLVVVVLGVLAASGAVPDDDEPAAPADRVVIGVSPDAAHGGAGARVERIVPNGPAEAAGLAAGDVILRLAGEEVSGPDALRRLVGAQAPGVPVPVEVARGPSTRVFQVTPELASRIPRKEVGLAEPIAPPQTCFPLPVLPQLLRWVIVLTVVAALAALVARRAPAGAARGVWWTGLAVAAASVGSYVAPAAACAALGGMTAMGEVLALWGSTLALGAVALAGWRRVGDAPGPPPTRSWGSAARLGAWYLVTGTPRVAVLTFALAQVATAGEPGGGTPVESLARGLGAMEGVPGLLLLAAPALLFAPVGEELAFRGLLQPALGRWLRPAAAVGVTSVVFAGMHWYYGLKLPILVLVAAVLGWARLASGGLRAPIVLHALVNAVGLAVIAAEVLRRG